ncbi:MAG TPA: amidohydrolase, partial [Gammaproteobacteria bacterium]|nr:amidohydrolase [Gammaproteobacteria bacterium]
MFRFMQLGISALLMALVASWVVAAPYDSTYVPRPTADFVIRNAVVYDGTGAEPKVSDVVVKDGRISAMGVDLNLEGLQIIDAKG